MFKKNSISCPKLPRPSGVPLRGKFPLAAILVLCSLVLSACQSIPPLPPVNLSEPGWRLRQGQTVWRRDSKSPEITGDLLIATNPDGRSFVQFTKTPFPFVIAQTTSNSWQIHFVANNKTYSARGRPPARLAWLQLPRCLAGNSPPARWNWTQLDNGGFRFNNPATGESLEGFLNP